MAFALSEAGNILAIWEPRVMLKTRMTNVFVVLKLPLLPQITSEVSKFQIHFNHKWKTFRNYSSFMIIFDQLELFHYHLAHLCIHSVCPGSFPQLSLFPSDDVFQLPISHAGWPDSQKGGVAYRITFHKAFSTACYKWQLLDFHL